MSPDQAEALEQALAPPVETTRIPGIGGTLKSAPEDFVVTEVPAYPPDGGEDRHLFLTLQKRGLTTVAAVRDVARALDVAPRDVGVAGQKDRHAVTTQWISVPAAARSRLAQFDHPAITLGPPHPHSSKLRRGHLRGNRFTLTVRDLPDPESAAHTARAKLEALDAAGGCLNVFGEQRFGREGRNAVEGLEQLRSGRRPRRGDFVLSAGQSVLFNHLVCQRLEQDLLGRVLAGDVLKKTATGGLFTSEDPEVDQARFEAGELALTGPIFGGKTMRPPPDTPARDLEDAALACFDVPETALAALGKRAPGTRRRLRVNVAEWGVRPLIPANALEVQFFLPSGSYATVVMREICRPTPPA